MPNEQPTANATSSILIFFLHLIMANANHYQVLGIDIQANDAVIKKAYRRVALKNHPDKTMHLSTAEIEQRTQIFKLATTAQEVLLDSAKRKSYHKTLARAVRPSNTPTTRPPSARPPPARPTPARPPPAPAPDAPGFKRPPPPRTTSRGTDPFQPPKFHYFDSSREPPSSKATQTSPQTPHPFTAGSPTTYPPPTPYFHAPVTETAERTILTYSNNDKWSFSIGISKKYEWTLAPTRPCLGEETKDMIAIKFRLKRTATTPATVFISDVVLTVESTPDSRSVAVSSIFAERKDGIDVWITLAGIGEAPASAIPPPVKQWWMWTWDIDMGFLVPFYRTLRATHLMFYPQYPVDAVAVNGSTPPTKGPFPMGSPAAELVRIFGEMVFVGMTRQSYCQEVKREGETFWQLAAVGHV